MGVRGDEAGGIGRPGWSRRRVLGALGGGALVATSRPGEAGATPARVSRMARPEALSAVGGAPRGSPLTSTIASPPLPGVIYRFQSYWGFIPRSGTISLESGGAYAPDDAGGMVLTTFELPPGAVLRDAEFYTHNILDPVTVGVELVAPTASVTLAETSVAKSSDPQAKALTIPSAVNGPFPHVCSLLVYVMGTSDVALVKGARVGYTVGPAQLMVLPSPTRVYDSRTSGGAIAAGATRTVSLASAVPANATAALFTLSITDTVGFGTLRAGRAGVTPTATAIQWYGSSQKATTSVTSRLNGGREIVLQSFSSSGPTHAIVDVIGYYG